MLALYLIDRFRFISRRQEGQAMAEYGIILALIAAVVIGTLVTLGGDILTAFQKITAAL